MTDNERVYPQGWPALGRDAQRRERVRESFEESIRVRDMAAIPVIGFRLIHPAARKPTRATPGSTGWDLYAARPATILPHSAGTLETGVSVEPPPYWAFCVRPRSGLSRKGIWAATGTIDQDYRGDIGVTLLNWTAAAYHVAAGDRIAQLVLEPVCDCRWEERAELGETERGSGGFGHTGK